MHNNINTNTKKKKSKKNAQNKNLPFMSLEFYKKERRGQLENLENSTYQR